MNLVTSYARPSSTTQQSARLLCWATSAMVNWGSGAPLSRFGTFGYSGTAFVTPSSSRSVSLSAGSPPSVTVGSGSSAASALRSGSSAGSQSNTSCTASARPAAAAPKRSKLSYSGSLEWNDSCGARYLIVADAARKPAASAAQQPQISSRSNKRAYEPEPTLPAPAPMARFANTRCSLPHGDLRAAHLRGCKFSEREKFPKTPLKTASDRVPLKSPRGRYYTPRRIQ